MSLRKKKIEKKKEEILRSAAEVLNEKGYHGATMEDIATKLLMTKGSMYYYFKNKEDLYFQCHRMMIDKSNEKIEDIINSEKSPLEKLRSAIISHIKLATTEKSMFSLMDKPEQKFSGEYLEDILQQRSEYEKNFDQIINEGIQSGEFDHVDVKLLRLLILGSLNWILEWYSPDGGKTQDEISEAFSDYLLRIVKKPC
ncbi:MAG: TetR/AcrR family transcriptional regulator [Bacillaceae bacterium]|nr:TetR/AcrR family transcriptional regulator [Bacillaceae bacterium]